MTYYARFITPRLLAAALLFGVAFTLPFGAFANVGDGTCFGTGDKAAGECGSAGGGGGGGGPTIYIPMSTLSVTPTTITQGQSATLSWSCHELSGQDEFVGYTSDFGAASKSGSMSVAPSQTTTYTFTCYSSSGSTDTKTATLTVNAAYPDVYAGATSPSSATAGTPVTLSSTVTNQGSGTATNFPNVFQISGIGYVAAQTHTLGSGASAALSASYTFSAAGNYQVRACANTNTSGAAVIAESDLTNNCAASWTTVVVGAAPQPDVTASAPSITPVAGSLSAILHSIISNVGTAATNQ